jgi:hypothetical protein
MAAGSGTSLNYHLYCTATRMFLPREDVIKLTVVSDSLIWATGSRHKRSFINGCIDCGFDAVWTNCHQQFPHETDIWPELSRSNMRHLIIRRPTDTEKQQLDIF